MIKRHPASTQLITPWLHALFTGLFTLLCTTGLAQSGKLKIKVRSDNDPLHGASVVINEGEKSGITDDDGEFEWKNIPYGVYRVKVTMLGYKSEVKT
ncbi:MAG TPA: carboxypeptidase-like regulatory domain-containing protein, partial [Agriterribacter sp.]|nr:carboxypeptidase-like regulatory domain-containing protein [Agriterribacter sp.]